MGTGMSSSVATYLKCSVSTKRKRHAKNKKCDPYTEIKTYAMESSFEGIQMEEKWHLHKDVKVSLITIFKEL